MQHQALSTGVPTTTHPLPPQGPDEESTWGVVGEMLRASQMLRLFQWKFLWKINYHFSSVVRNGVIPPLYPSGKEWGDPREEKNIFSYFWRCPLEMPHSHGFCEVWNLWVKLTAKTLLEKKTTSSKIALHMLATEHIKAPQEAVSHLCVIRRAVLTWTIFFPVTYKTALKKTKTARREFGLELT